MEFPVEPDDGQDAYVNAPNDDHQYGYDRKRPPDADTQSQVNILHANLKVLFFFTGPGTPKYQRCNVESHHDWTSQSHDQCHGNAFPSFADKYIADVCNSHTTSKWQNRRSSKI